MRSYMYSAIAPLPRLTFLFPTLTLSYKAGACARGLSTLSSRLFFFKKKAAWLPASDSASWLRAKAYGSEPGADPFPSYPVNPMKLMMMTMSRTLTMPTMVMMMLIIEPFGTALSYRQY